MLDKPSLRSSEDRRMSLTQPGHLMYFFLSLLFSSPASPFTRRDDQYLLLKLVNGELHFTVSGSSIARTDDRLHPIQTRTQLNDGQWHHVSLHRASDHHIEFIVDTKQYTRLISLHVLDRIFFGRPSDIYLFNPITTLKACYASLTINSHTVNLREHIRSNAQIRNDCLLDSQCPLRTCQNTGECLDRIQCQCQHTSFQGRFCTDLKLGYSFGNQTPGLIFDQPVVRERPLLLYQLSFGLVTRMNIAEIIRVNDQLQIELYRGCIRVRFNGNELIRSDRLVNDGAYHLIQIGYNMTRYLYLHVDNQPVSKQLDQPLPLDQSIVLLIGKNPAFKHSFQVRASSIALLAVPTFSNGLFFRVSSTAWNPVATLCSISSLQGSSEYRILRREIDLFRRRYSIHHHLKYMRMYQVLPVHTSRTMTFVCLSLIQVLVHYLSQIQLCYLRHPWKSTRHLHRRSQWRDQPLENLWSLPSSSTKQWLLPPISIRQARTIHRHSLPQSAPLIQHDWSINISGSTSGYTWPLFSWEQYSVFSCASVLCLNIVAKMRVSTKSKKHNVFDLWLLKRLDRPVNKLQRTSINRAPHLRRPISNRANGRNHHWPQRMSNESFIFDLFWFFFTTIFLR